MEASLPAIRDVEKPMTVEQAQKTIDGWAKSMSSFGGEDSELIKSRFVLAAAVAMRLPTARQALLKMGKTQEQLNTMPAAQVVLLEALLEYNRLRDQLLVWFNVPFVEGARGIEISQSNIRKIKIEAEGNLFLATLISTLPGTEQLHFAGVRIDRKIAALRTIEALRLHAAVNHHGFPAELADITIVPVPTDPVTGKPFEYKLTDDGKALLSGEAPKGRTPAQGNTLLYELTLSK